MQPYLLPYIGYWQLINAVDTFIIYDDVTFIKQSFINRNYILVQNHKHMFTIPLFNASSNQIINNIMIMHPLNKVLKTIEQSYKKAAYFKDAFPVINEIFSCNEKELALFIKHSLIKICNYLNINTKFIFSKNIRINKKLPAEDKLIELTKKCGSNHYINTIGGQSLYCKSHFKKNGIKLSFIQTSDISYKQFGNNFINNLSIIDILMFNSKNDIQKMLLNYKLV